MQVYKAFFKVILKNLSQLIIYVVVFLVLALILTNTYTPPASTDFTASKINIVFINDDEPSVLVDGLKNYLGKTATLVDIPNDTQKLQDALFFRKAEYILRVPNGFAKNLLAGKETSVEKTIIPDSTSSIYMDLLINKYLNTAKAYTAYTENIRPEDLVRFIDHDLSEHAETIMTNQGIQSGAAEKSGYYFNYLAYSLFAILILGVCSVMIVFNDPDLKKRNQSSPLKASNMNFQMVLGNISFAVLTWLIMIIPSFVMYGNYMLTPNGLLLLLNAFVFTIAALSISYLFGNIVKSRGAMSAIANVFSLGTCFISGVFVPQSLLGANVLTIASFTPTYWYVKANNEISTAVSFNAESLTSIFTSMLLVLTFGIAVFAVTLVIIKQKRVTV